MLCDYLSNLHVKFLSENLDIKTSFATFTRLRPKHISHVSYGSRNVCLCQRHQNMALKLRGLKKIVGNIDINPDNFIRRDDDDHDDLKQRLHQFEDLDVYYNDWGCDEGDKKFKLLNRSLKVKDFIPLFFDEVAAFRQHCTRAENQYREMRNLKMNLPLGHIIVQMDFAENFSCRTFEDVQSAYWGAVGVTIHPCVVYYKLDEGAWTDSEIQLRRHF